MAEGSATVIHLVQRPRRDELLTSVLIRTARHTGLPIYRVTQALTGRQKWRPSFFQCGHITEISKVLKMEPVSLLQHHTVFPYSTAFLTPEVLLSSLENVFVNGPAAVAMGATTQSVSDQVRRRRLCVDCVKQDIRRWGESYWHRAHNLPGVLLCLEHNRLLRETNLPTSGAASWSYLLPDEVKETKLVSKKATKFDAELARQSVNVLNQTSTQFVPNPAWYRQQIHERGLCSVDRQINAQKLSKWVGSVIGAKATRYGFSERDTDLDWLRLMIRPAETVPFIPLKHLVLQTTLQLQPPVLSPKLDHVPSGPSSGFNSSVDRSYANAVRQIVACHLASKATIKVSDALKLAGCWSTYRHNPERLPKVQAEVMQLRRSAASARPISIARY